MKTPYPCRPQGELYYFAAISLKYAFGQDLTTDLALIPAAF
jgi:hypothetical protein